MEEIESFPKKMVDIETVILKPRFDSCFVKMEGEKLKTSFFSRFGFLKPRVEHITIVALNRYYEPFVVIGGKYSIDYCKRHNYAIEVRDETHEVFINGKKFASEPLAQEKRKRVVNLKGEEYSSYQTETYLVLDRTMQEVSPEELPLAPFDYELEKQQDPVFDLRKANTRLEEGIRHLRSKIVNRPSDVAVIAKEVFEITSRIAVFKPIYELVLQNVKDGRKVTALIDGITGEIDLKTLDHLSTNRFDEFFESPNQNLSRIHLSMGGQELYHAQNSIFSSSTTADELSQDSKTEKRLDSSIGASESISCALLNPEKATFLAINFLRNMGYQHDLKPTKLSHIGEDYMVEIVFEKGLAKVQVDAKTDKIKEYELEAEGKHFPTKSLGNVLIVFLAVSAALSILKLINFF